MLVLGTGLIGSALASEIEGFHKASLEWLPSPWADSSRLAKQLRTIADSVKRYPDLRVDWIWAAGKAGFDADASVLRQEMSNFSAALDVAQELQADLLTTQRLRFHLISSAGGLFESQTGVTTDSEPRPQRPYGELKLAQEQRLADRLGREASLIYRLSSVYGFPHSGHRRGLISTLIVNTRLQRVTPVVGRLDTCRDYVWAEDVARFIVSRIYSEQASAGPLMLVSARPASIFEIRHLVEKATRRRSYVQCAHADNAASMSFSKLALPRGFVPADLEVNIRRVARSPLIHDGSLIARSSNEIY